MASFPRAGAETTALSPVSAPSWLMNRIRWCTDSSPSRATDDVACREASPASMSLRKCAG